MKKSIWFIALLILITGCDGPANKSPDSNRPIQIEQKRIDNKDLNIQKLTKDASLTFQTKNIEETYDLVKKCLGDFNAFLSEDNHFNYRTRTGYDLTIKVPADKFESLLNFITENAKIKVLDNKTIQINDVTEESIDIQARIKIKKETELKLTDLLKQAKNLTEILEIQKQLSDLRAEIESIEGRLKYLTDQVNYSTIKLSFYEKAKYSKQFFRDFWDAIKEGWQVFLHIITLLAYLWVIILAFFIIRWGYIYYYKRKKK
jgi:hypothetical protein